MYIYIYMCLCVCACTELCRMQICVWFPLVSGETLVVGPARLPLLRNWHLPAVFVWSARRGSGQSFSVGAWWQCSTIKIYLGSPWRLVESPWWKIDPTGFNVDKDERGKMYRATGLQYWICLVPPGICSDWSTSHIMSWASLHWSKMHWNRK